MLIGVTGLTESGKNQVLDIIKSKYNNSLVLNINKIISSILVNHHPCYQELFSTFGKMILDKQNIITQDTLHLVALKGGSNGAKINEILGKYMITAINNIRDEHDVLILDTSLLLDYNLADICNKIIITIASSDVRARRLAERTKISYEQAHKRTITQREITYTEENSIYINTNDGINDNDIQKIINFINF